MTQHLGALAIGFLLDLLLGDPYWLPHPIRLFGKLIAALERLLRRMFPKTPDGELVAGFFLVLLTLTITTGGTALLLLLCGIVSPYLAFAVETVICYQMLATKCLKVESRKVYDALVKKDLPSARKAVSMIVGRDTESLTEEGVTKAAVETVAENAGDGVIAPMLFLAIGGAPLGVLYKASNTMDSMVGYQNDTYRYFGRCAAKWDDVCNFIPARLGGLFFCLAAPLVGLDGKNAFYIFLRDRKKHASPNSAHTEAAAAGALGVELAGDATYFGVLHHKETIGEKTREITPQDIVSVNRLLYMTAVLFYAVCCIAPLVIARLW